MSGKRSPGYPNYGLPQAIDRTRKIFDSVRRNPIDREVAAKAIGYSSLSGASDKALATLMHYDLLERVGKGEVRVSQLGVDILHPTNEMQKKRALMSAAFAPNLFRELKSRFPDDRFSDDALRSYLMRLNFLDRAVDPVIKAYSETCSYLAQSNAYESGGPDLTIDPESADEEAGDDAAPANNGPQAPVRSTSATSKPEMQLMDNERILTTGLLAKDVSFRLIVNGQVGVKEIERLIKKLELDKEILADTEDEPDFME